MVTKPPTGTIVWAGSSGSTGAAHHDHIHVEPPGKRTGTPPHTLSGPTPGVIAIQQAVRAAFPDLVTNEAAYGVCNRRYIAGTTIWSQHCVAGDTEVTTRDGLVPIAKLADIGTAELLTRSPFSHRLRGRWIEASVQSFGMADVTEITLAMWSRDKTIRATPEHRWFVQRGPRGQQRTYEVTTAELQPGDKLINVVPRHITRLQPSPFGIVAGLIFGDGHKEAAPTSGSCIRLWGAKVSMLRYFPPGLRQTPKQLPSGMSGIEVAGLPRAWKDRPPLSESTSYLAGWLAGYFAADGSVSQGGQISISSASRDDLEFLRVVAARLGIATRSPRQEPGGGYGSRPTWALYFVGLTVPDWLVLHEHHRANMRQSYRMARWSVVSTEPAGREEVYCATVPDTGAFALSDWILTGNSWCNAWDIGPLHGVEEQRAIYEFLTAGKLEPPPDPLPPPIIPIEEADMDPWTNAVITVFRVWNKAFGGHPTGTIQENRVQRVRRIATWLRDGQDDHGRPYDTGKLYSSLERQTTPEARKKRQDAITNKPLVPAWAAKA